MANENAQGQKIAQNFGAERQKLGSCQKILLGKNTNQPDTHPKIAHVPNIFGCGVNPRPVGLCGTLLKIKTKY